MSLRLARYRPEHLFIAACAAIVAALVYNALLQSRAAPDLMRYVPPESSAYLYSSSLRSVWETGKHHAARFFKSMPPAPDGKDSAPQSYASALAQELKTNLDKTGIKLTSVDDLQSIGIDAEAGAALAFVSAPTGVQTIWVVPVLDQTRFLSALQKWLEGKQPATQETVVKQRGSAYIVFDQKGVFVSFPEKKIAVVSSDRGTLLRALQDTDANLGYFRSTDSVIKGMSNLASPLTSPAWLRGNIQLDGYLPMHEVQLFVALSDEKVSVRTRATLLPGRAGVLHDLLREDRDARPDTRPKVTTVSNMAAVFRDPSLSSYLRLLTSRVTPAQRASLDRAYPGLLSVLEAAQRADQIAVGVAEGTGGVPDLVVGLKMPTQPAEALVFELQTRFRLDRDAELVAAALKAFDTAPGTRDPPSLPRLVQLGLLSNERDALWNRYELAKSNKIKLPSPFSKGEFDNETYIRRADGHVLRFILPPITTDDLRYRIAVADPERISTADLKNDRYRLCSAYRDDTLWLSNDAEALRRWLGRLMSPRTGVELREPDRRLRLRKPDKVQLVFYPPPLMEQGLLHPDPNIQEAARLYLSDLEAYQSAQVTIAPAEDEHAIYATLTLDRL